MALLRTRSQSGQTEIKLRSHDAVTQHEAQSNNGPYEPGFVVIYMYTYTKVIFSIYDVIEWVNMYLLCLL